MIFGSLSSSSTRIGFYVYICRVLAHKGKVIALIAKASSRCFNSFISGRHVCQPSDRLLYIMLAFFRAF